MTFLSDGPFETQEDLNVIKQKMTNPDDFMVSSKCQFSTEGSVSAIRRSLAICLSVLDSSTSRSVCTVISASDQLKKKKEKKKLTPHSQANQMCFVTSCDWFIGLCVLLRLHKA